MLEGKRRASWKKSSQPIDRVAFTLPPNWEREEVDAKSCDLHGPANEAGAAPVISIEVLKGPDDARLLGAELLKQHQAQEQFKLIESGVVTRDRGMQAAHLIYTCVTNGVKTAVREMVFTVGFQSVAYVHSHCPVDVVADHVTAINAVFDSLKPSRKLEVPGSIKAGL